jgi:hypothetical protein
MIQRPIFVYTEDDRLIGWIWPAACRYAERGESDPPV